MANPAELSDLQARVTDPIGADQQDRALALLADAWVMVRTEVPSLESRMASGEVLPEVVVLVICAMVKRVLDNPRGLRQGSRTIDDFTESWTLDNAISTGGLYLGDAERALLEPAMARLKARSMGLGSPESYTDYPNPRARWDRWDVW